MIDDEAWPSAQALTSWANSVTILFDKIMSTVTLEPQSLLTFVTDLLGFFRRPTCEIFAANSIILLFGKSREVIFASNLSFLAHLSGRASAFLSANSFFLMVVTGPFSAICENVLQNFKGYFDSSFTVTGSFYKPNFKGHIKANNSSFDVPYLGVRYAFPENPYFILDKMSIYMDNFKIQDTQMNSFGILDGKINHDRLKDWFLDFNIKSENLLAINTSYDDNDFYYGTGYLNGSAKFYGPGKNLDINISGFAKKKLNLSYRFSL